MNRRRVTHRASLARLDRKETNVTLMDLFASLRARVAREEGQTMAEYGVVLAVIALAVIVAFTALSGGISHAINNIAAVLP